MHLENVGLKPTCTPAGIVDIKATVNTAGPPGAAPNETPLSDFASPGKEPGA